MYNEKKILYAKVGDKLNDTKFGKKFSEFMNDSWGEGLSALGNHFGNIASGSPNGGELASNIKGGIRAVTDKLGPIGKAVGITDDLFGGISAMAGKTLAGISTGDQIISSIPIVGNLASFFGGSLTKHNFDQSKVASDFSFNKEQAASDLGGKNMLFGKGKKEKQIARAWQLYNTKADISEYNAKRLNNYISADLNDKNMLQFSGGMQSYSLGKNGMKFPELDEARDLIKSWKAKKVETPKFQLGGKVNLIPEGHLHARKHNLEEINPELEGQITKKGIPVISKSEGGEIVQHAEVECNEWTLCKETTDKIESLYKDYLENPSDDIAIKAGQLICHELLKNTDDRSGLIKSVE